MELIRLLLLEREGAKVDLSPYSEAERLYHSALIIEAGLVDGRIVPDQQGMPAMAVMLRLTWEGHDFLDAARNETIWRKVMDTAKAQGLSLTLGVLKELLVSLLKQAATA